ncbi:GntR family transcriptional regulator [Amycolatopsis sp. TNS106]|uniref:GntR family transcriptional regulator n=1 Tax=Amycolatopsis sp. TNS106 TaxID=2861750 RepID=UPI002105D686|nr:GntR family transcriptional regulator [Amycolatopsis sp. TNS106]
MRIAAEWAEKIDSGELRHGDPLPTREELAETYGVSKTVIRDALGLLHQDGYLQSNTRRGTSVFRLARYELPMYVLEADDRGRDAFTDAVEAQGGRPYQHIRVETIVPSGSIKSALELADNDLVLARRRMRTIDGVPYCITDSYFPFDLVKGTEIADPTDIQRGGRHVLREHGHEMVRHRDSIRSRRPHAREISELEISSGLPVIRHDRTSYTASGQPVRLMASAFPSDRWELTYEVEK